MKRIILIIILSSAMVSSGFPGFLGRTWAEGISNEPAKIRLIGFIFKVVAKGIVVAVTPNALKTEAVDKINKMSEEDFRVRYHDFYEHFANNRVSTDAYGFHSKMTRSEAVEFINTLNKDKMFALIEFLPDTFIANEFKRYLFKHRQTVPDSNNIYALFDRVNKMLIHLKDKYLSP